MAYTLFSFLRILFCVLCILLYGLVVIVLCRKPSSLPIARLQLCFQSISQSVSEKNQKNQFVNYEKNQSISQSVDMAYRWHLSMIPISLSLRFATLCPRGAFRVGAVVVVVVRHLVSGNGRRLCTGWIGQVVRKDRVPD